MSVRKSYTLTQVRDDWDPKRPEYEKQLTDLLGVDWKCEVDPLSIVPYAGEHAGNMGKVFAR